ncbi:MAG: molybdopterin-binding protein [Thermoleophilia bacterium]|nr:molybdopterin-binding protein [Thermoleophilia bacterium]
MRTQEIPIDESVGLTLAYDLTGITPGKAKGAVLRRGHVIHEDDLELLRDIGKSYVQILELAPDEVHEDDAALTLGRLVAGEGIEVTLPGEAWADLVATTSGLLKVDAERLLKLNLLDEVLIATRHDNTPVGAGELVARAKVRGLAVRQDVLDDAQAIAGGPSMIMEILPYRSLRAGAIITGREIYEGRRKDAFEPLLRRRLEEHGSALVHTEIVPDEVPAVCGAITTALSASLDLVLVTGGGSPDDCTSVSIAQIADDVVFHGVPVAPGAMTMLAYAGEVPILGVPAGLLARPRGFIDLVLPRLLAGERLTSLDAAGYGHGGLCLRCETCLFPVCPFGK